MGMPWDAVAGGLQGWNHGYVTRKQAQANNRLRRVNIQEGDKVRQAGNAAEAATNSLQRWSQSITNKRTLEAGGEALEANLVNARREADADLNMGFSDSIRSAEAQGAARAAQAAAGVDGGVVDQINGSMALRSSIVEQQLADFKGFKNFDVARRAGNIMSQTVGGLDSSLILDTFDMNVEAMQEEATFNNWAYALRGMAEHMGGGGSIDSGLKQQEERSRELEADAKEQMDYADANERKLSAELDNTADAAADDRYKFGWKLNEDRDPYNPYDIDAEDYYSGDY
jgi:hypothetical protein